MPRFTLLDLLLATPLIGLGIVAIWFSLQAAPMDKDYFLSMRYVAASSTLIGAGLGMLYPRKLRGMLIGFALGPIVGVAIYVIVTIVLMIWLVHKMRRM